MEVNAPRPYKATFKIPGLPPTLNELNTMCWQKRGRLSRFWKDQVIMAIRNYRTEKPLRRARICFTRHSSKPVDMDNWAGSAKCILDALKGSVIVDDSMEIIDTEYKWQKAEVNKGFVEIRIEELS